VSIIAGVEYRSWNGVAITPGDTPLTRMLSLTSSFARPRVNVDTKPFAEAYITEPGPPPWRAAVDLTVVVLPFPVLRMLRAAAAPIPVEAPVMRTDLPARSAARVGSDIERPLLGEEGAHALLVADAGHRLGEQLRAGQRANARAGDRVG